MKLVYAGFRRTSAGMIHCIMRPVADGTYWINVVVRDGKAALQSVTFHNLNSRRMAHVIGVASAIEAEALAMAERAQLAYDKQQSLPGVK